MNKTMWTGGKGRRGEMQISSRAYRNILHGEKIDSCQSSAERSEKGEESVVQRQSVPWGGVCVDMWPSAGTTAGSFLIRSCKCFLIINVTTDLLKLGIY